MKLVEEISTILSQLQYLQERLAFKIKDLVPQLKDFLVRIYHFNQDFFQYYRSLPSEEQIEYSKVKKLAEKFKFHDVLICGGYINVTQIYNFLGQDVKLVVSLYIDEDKYSKEDSVGLFINRYIIIQVLAFQLNYMSVEDFIENYLPTLLHEFVHYFQQKNDIQYSKYKNLPYIQNPVEIEANAVALAFLMYKNGNLYSFVKDILSMERGKFVKIPPNLFQRGYRGFARRVVIDYLFIKSKSLDDLPKDQYKDFIQPYEKILKKALNYYKDFKRYLKP